MKKIMKHKIAINILIIILSINLFSCEKNTIPPFPTSNNIYYNEGFPDCYIATGMKISCSATDSRPLNHGDTIKYSQFIIYLSFSGELISQGTMGSSNNYLELFSYYINIVKKVEVNSDKNYINNISCITNSINHLNYVDNIEVINPIRTLVNNKLGYSPFRLMLKTPPDNSDYYSFTIGITDIYDNHFVATTDSIYITK